MGNLNGLIKQYANYGRVSPGGEIYLPISKAKEFVHDCKRLELAVIGLDFFEIHGGQVVPSTPIDGLDASPILETHGDWQHIVEKCYRLALHVLDEVVESKLQLCIVTAAEGGE